MRMATITTKEMKNYCKWKEIYRTNRRTERPPDLRNGPQQCQLPSGSRKKVRPDFNYLVIFTFYLFLWFLLFVLSWFLIFFFISTVYNHLIFSSLFYDFFLWFLLFIFLWFPLFFMIFFFFLFPLFIIFPSSWEGQRSSSDDGHRVHHTCRALCGSPDGTRHHPAYVNKLWWRKNGGKWWKMVWWKSGRKMV